MSSELDGDQKLTYEKCKPYVDKFISNLKHELGSTLLAVALFGSVARAEASRHSDIDLLIVHKNVQYDMCERVVRLQIKLRESEEYRDLHKAGFTTEIFNVLLSEDELKSTPWVLLDIQDHGIILYDERGILKRKFEALRKRLKELGSRKVVLPDGTWYWDLKPDWKPGEVIEL
jgi:hypothetical protein